MKRKLIWDYKGYSITTDDCEIFRCDFDGRPLASNSLCNLRKAIDLQLLVNFTNKLEPEIKKLKEAVNIITKIKEQMMNVVEEKI